MNDLGSRRARYDLGGALGLVAHAVFVAFLLLASARPAAAHLMPARQGTAHVVGNSVFVAVSVPVSALHGFDDDGDGLLSVAELRVHQLALRSEIDRRLTVSDSGIGATTETLDLVLSPGHAGTPDRADQVIALEHTRFALAPAHLRLATDLFGALDAERQITITASREVSAGKEVEAGVFTPTSPAHEYFRPLSSVFAGFVRVGVAHVLSGADHLLFLLTLLLVGRTLGYWLRVVTAFTIAHSATLAAAALGYLHVPTSIVEPLIALSIVIAAVDNLLRERAAERQKVCLAAACGLLHGLGFASSMDAMGLDSAHMLASLLGFNAGVEVGQGLCVVGWVASLVALKRLLPSVKPGHLVRVASVLAATVGSWWVVQRIAI